MHRKRRHDEVEGTVRQRILQPPKAQRAAVMIENLPGTGQHLLTFVDAVDVCLRQCLGDPSGGQPAAHPEVEDRARIRLGDECGLR